MVGRGGKEERRDAQGRAKEVKDWMKKCLRI